MVKKIFFIICYSCLSLTAVSQAVLFINSGSRAAWGNNQELTIDKNGSCRYYLREVNGPVRDSAFFNISSAALQNFLNRADQLGFFGLNNIYTGKAVDGAGIYISMNNAGKKHNVQLVNIDQPIINELIARLNTMLMSQSIIINYGQFVTKQ